MGTTTITTRATASTVDAAFGKFLRDSVNLAPDDSRGARRSRDWLRGKLNGFDGTHDDFPFAYKDKHIDFGSFARRTKIRPLDDVDLIHCLKSEGATYLDVGSRVELTTVDNTRLAGFRHADSKLLSSTRVLNKFKKHLDEVPQYSSAKTHRNHQAVTLELTSYDWNFDIVPGFFTTPELDGRTYYIIPDGQGHWMKTDPRKDRERVTTVNLDHSGRVLDVLRALKYWNRRPTMPSVPSYAFENLILGYYAGQSTTASEYVDIEVVKVLEHIRTAIFGAIPDPKGIQGDLNTLSLEQRFAVAVRASLDSVKAADARKLEREGDQKASITKWGEVFGSDFPSYSEN